MESTSLDGPSIKGVDVQFMRDSTGARHAVFTSIGTMRAVNVATGRVWSLNLETGTSHTIAEDFDGDGDLDIGMIGFFADINDPSARDFVYLEQNGPMEFVPHAPPIGDEGRWLSMDAGDYDGDNDVDLILGNFPRRYGSASSSSSTSRLPFLVLENRLRQPPARTE